MVDTLPNSMAHRQEEGHGGKDGWSQGLADAVRSGRSGDLVYCLLVGSTRHWSFVLRSRINRTRLPPPASCLLSPVSCILSPVFCILHSASCIPPSVPRLPTL